MALARGEIDPGLERVQAALAVVGSPQEALAGRALHIAGTNGKGSVCALCFAVLKSVGLSVGMFTSPHLLEPADAVALACDGEDRPLGADEWSNTCEEVAQSCGPGLSLTVFELQVVSAMVVFERRNLDVVIIEVGMGGRDDATNVLVNPAVCAITSIAMDHERFLGPSLEDIARHKAGIFQEGRPAIVATADMSESVLAAIEECAESVGAAPLRWLSPAMRCSDEPQDTGQSVQYMQVEGLSATLAVPCLGSFQLSNVAVAVAMLHELRTQGLAMTSRDATLDEDLLDDEAIASGIRAARWPGRLQWLDTGMWGRVLLDGAHNVAAARHLASYVAELRGGGRPITWLCAFSAGKDVRGILDSLLVDRDAVFAVPFSRVEGMPWVRHEDPEAVCAAAQLPSGPQLRCCHAFESLSEALDEASATSVGAQIVVCGSLYLAADLLRLLARKAVEVEAADTEGGPLPEPQDPSASAA